jgi:hypothetical protein
MALMEAGPMQDDVLDGLNLTGELTEAAGAAEATEADPPLAKVIEIRPGVTDETHGDEENEEAAAAETTPEVEPVRRPLTHEEILEAHDFYYGFLAAKFAHRREFEAGVTGYGDNARPMVIAPEDIKIFFSEEHGTVVLGPNHRTAEEAISETGNRYGVFTRYTIDAVAAVNRGRREREARKRSS